MRNGQINLGGMRNTDFQKVITPEDFTDQHKHIASAAEELVILRGASYY